MKRLLTVATVLAVFAAFGARAQTAVDNLADGRAGKIYFNSLTPIGAFSLVRGSAVAVTVYGTLLLPPGNERVPAIVIAHGSNGLAAREMRWARVMTDAGYAAFMVDSFRPRGIDHTYADQSKVPTAANVADALAALKLLASHPRIDPARIGVIGFSKGGQVALYTSLEPYRRAVLGDSTVKFAAHVALYPYCNDWQVSEKVTGVPLLMLLGGNDDYTPPEPCHGYADWFRGKGAHVDVVVYPGAYHAFDGSLPLARAHVVVTGRNCSDTIDLDRMTVALRPSGEDVTANFRAYFRQCMTRGAMMGGDPKARKQAPQDVLAFLKQASGN